VTWKALMWASPAASLCMPFVAAERRRRRRRREEEEQQHQQHQKHASMCNPTEEQEDQCTEEEASGHMRLMFLKNINIKQIRKPPFAALLYLLLPSPPQVVRWIS